MTDWTPKAMHLRQNVLRTLMSHFPNETPASVYDTAELWVDTHNAVDGVVEYFKERYNRN